MTGNKIEEERLMLRIKCNDVAAFNILFDQYWDVAFKHAYKRLQCEEDARDIVQEIFLNIWNSRKEIEISDIEAYLFISVRNRVLNLWSRKKKHDPILEFLPNSLFFADPVDQKLLYKDFIQKLHRFLETLPPRRREIFRLRFFEDLSTKEVSKTLGISRKSVQNQLGIARDDLMAALDEGKLNTLFICFTLFN